MLVSMGMPYRLDMRLDLFDLELDNHTLLLGQQELHAVQTRLDEVFACWSEPSTVQLWAAVTDVLGRDPRR